MAVYKGNSMNNRGRENLKLYRGTRRAAAADLPPEVKNAEHKEKAHEEKTADENKKGKFLDGLIDEFFDGGIDSDKLLIAALLYMLIKEGADIKLMIALGYILM